MKEQTINSWYVGQKVWCVLHGEGKIERICDVFLRPIQVTFENGRFTNYDFSGKGNGTNLWKLW